MPTWPGVFGTLGGKSECAVSYYCFSSYKDILLASLLDQIFIIFAQVPICATSSPALLALALRLPPSASADWVVSSLAAALPQGTCISSSMQLDIRTDIQVRILGQIPFLGVSSPASGETDSSSGSSEQLLWAAALGTQAMLIPPMGPSVSLFMGSGAQPGKSSFGVISAASTSGSETAPGVAASSQSGGGGSSSSGIGGSAVTTALLATLGSLLAVVSAVVAVICLRKRRRTSINANAVVAFNKLVSSHPPDSLAASTYICRSSDNLTAGQSHASARLSNRSLSLGSLANMTKNTLYDGIQDDSIRGRQRTPAVSLKGSETLAGADAGEDAPMVTCVMASEEGLDTHADVPPCSDSGGAGPKAQSLQVARLSMESDIGFGQSGILLAPMPLHFLLEAKTEALTAEDVGQSKTAPQP